MLLLNQKKILKLNIFFLLFFFFLLILQIRLLYLVDYNENFFLYMLSNECEYDFYYNLFHKDNYKFYINIFTDQDFIKEIFPKKSTNFNFLR